MYTVPSKKFTIISILPKKKKSIVSDIYFASIAFSLNTKELLLQAPKQVEKPFAFVNL